MILVDAGPLVALVDRRDTYASMCVQVAATIREPIVTVWPVLAEAMHLLDGVPHGYEQLWQLYERSALAIAGLDARDVPRMRELMRKYADLPMDLADAALVRVAERENIRRIFTVDRRDFEVYRPHRIRHFEILP